MSFDSLGLAEPIVRAVREQGYTQPTPIQAQAIPAVLKGGDLMAGAQTGTGKTAAFTLPVLHLLSQREAGKNRFGGKAIRALVLTPTRELAAQVDDEAGTVVEGTFNGLAAQSMAGHLHFSGAINAGMSGGPTVDATGAVVGAKRCTIPRGEPSAAYCGTCSLSSSSASERGPVRVKRVGATREPA